MDRMAFRAIRLAMLILVIATGVAITRTCTDTLVGISDGLPVTTSSVDPSK
jgi:hypothetical protein